MIDKAILSDHFSLFEISTSFCLTKVLSFCEIGLQHKNKRPIKNKTRVKFTNKKSFFMLLYLLLISNVIMVFPFSMNIT